MPLSRDSRQPSNSIRQIRKAITISRGPCSKKATRKQHVPRIKKPKNLNLAELYLLRKRLVVLNCRGVPPWAPLVTPTLTRQRRAPTEGRPNKSAFFFDCQCLLSHDVFERFSLAAGPADLYHIRFL